MSSVLRARRDAETETGAGGKIVRRRRYAVAGDAVHPYRRPESPPRPDSPSWISGILAPARTIAAGAGKILSFAFGSSSPSPSDSSSSSSSDSDDDEDDDYVEDESTGKLNQNGTTPMLTEEHPLNAQPSAQKSESKRAIEHLLLQETFTRDECAELMRMIQSRVVDCPTMKEGEDATPRELYGRAVGNDITVSGAWRSPLQYGKSTAAYPYSMNSSSAFSPGSSAFREQTPNLCDTAIKEAKKWIKEKKLEPCSNSERDHRRCSLSIDVLPQVIEGDMASPVDMAKSYMQSRPRWASPSWNNTEFQTPPPIGMLHYSNESSHSMGHYSLPSTKELKRNSLGSGPQGTLDETRRVRLKSTEDLVDHHADKQISSSATIFNDKHTQTLPVSNKEVIGTQDSSFLPAANSVDGSQKLPKESVIDKNCRNGILHPSDENAGEVNLLVTNHAMDRTNNLASNENILESEEIVGAEYLRHGISLSASLPLETEHSGPEKGIPASHPIAFISEKSEGLEEAPTAKELVNSDLGFHESPVPDSISVQHDGARAVLNSEPGVALLARDVSMLPRDADDVANHKTVCDSSPQMSYQAGHTVQTEKTLQLHESPVLEEKYSFLGSISQGEDQKQNDANALGNGGADVNGSFFSETSLNAEKRLKPPDETAQNSTSLDHGEVAVHKTGESCELPSEASIEVSAPNETTTFSDELQNGTTNTMNEAPEVKPQKKLGAARARMRGRKAGYHRRGRGRGK